MPRTCTNGCVRQRAPGSYSPGKGRSTSWSRSSFPGATSETPGNSTFIDEHEWWRTRDLATFLTVGAAIEFQKQHDWPAVRRDCHALLVSCLGRLQELTGLNSLYPDDTWYVQMAAGPLPNGVDVEVLHRRLVDAYRVEAPILSWNEKKLIRISIQAYNGAEDVDRC